MARAKCSYSKKDMHTKGSAISAALRYSKKRGTPLRPYFHHQCRSWHLSSKPRWECDNLSTKEEAV